MPQDDWSVQLKKIEREFEGLPPEPSRASESTSDMQYFRICSRSSSVNGQPYRSSRDAIHRLKLLRHLLVHHSL